jgi:hypothetical protein
MPAQVSRFRAMGDSVDLMVAALAPLDSIRAATAIECARGRELLDARMDG